MSTAIVERAFRDFGSARPFVIDTDAMAPTLRSHRDVAMMMPVSDYQGEGIYALTSPGGGIAIYRVQGSSGRKLRLMCDNKVYSDQIISLADFREEVLAKIVGRIEFYDHQAYLSFVEAFGLQRNI